MLFAICCWSLVAVRCSLLRVVARRASCIVCGWLLDVCCLWFVVSVCDVFVVRGSLSVVPVLSVVLCFVCCLMFGI